MRLTFQVTSQDMLEVKCLVKEQRLKGWSFNLLGVGFVLLGVWTAVLKKDLGGAMAVSLGGSALLFLDLVVPRIPGLADWYFNFPQNLHKLEIGLDGVGTIDPQREVPISWLSWVVFRRWLLTENLLILMIPGNNDTLVIPKRCASEDQWKELLELVQAKLGEPARW